MANEQLPKIVMDLLNSSADKLSEHCDTVRIFITRTTDDGKHTGAWSVGRGSYYAQYGQIIDWINVKESQTAADAADDREPQE